MERQLTFKCPACDRKLAPVPGMDVAVQVVKRKCRCGKRWQLKINPVKLTKVNGFADVAEFTEVG